MEDALKTAIQMEDLELSDALLDTKLVDAHSLTSRDLGKYSTPEILETLERRGCNLHKLRESPDSYQNLLYYACAYNRADLASFLISKGFDPLEHIPVHGQLLAEYFSKNKKLEPVLREPLQKLEWLRKYDEVVAQIPKQYWTKIFSKVLKDLKIWNSQQKYQYVIEEIKRYGWSLSYNNVVREMSVYHEGMEWAELMREIHQAHENQQWAKLMSEIRHTYENKQWTKLMRDIRNAYPRRQWRHVMNEMIGKHHKKQIERIFIEMYQMFAKEDMKPVLDQLKNTFYKKNYNAVIAELNKMFAQVKQAETYLNARKQHNQVVDHLNSKANYDAIVADLNRMFALVNQADTYLNARKQYDTVVTHLKSIFAFDDEWKCFLEASRNYGKVVDQLKAFGQFNREYELQIIENEARENWSEVMSELKWESAVNELWLEAKQNQLYRDNYNQVIEEIEVFGQNLQLIIDQEQRNSYQRTWWNVLDELKENAPMYLYDQVVREIKARQYKLIDNFTEAMSEDEQNTEEAWKIMHSGFDCTIEDENGCQPIHWLSCFGKVYMIEYVLMLGADPNEESDHPDGKYTPLLFAAMWNNVEVAQCLLKHGADINYTTEDTDVFTVCGSVEMEKLLEKYSLLSVGIDFDPTYYVSPNDTELYDYLICENDYCYLLNRAEILKRIDETSYHMSRLWGKIWFHPDNTIVKKWHNTLKTDLSNLKSTLKNLDAIRKPDAPAEVETESEVVEEHLPLEETYNQIERDIMTEDNIIEDEPTAVSNQRVTVSFDFSGDLNKLVKVLEIIRETLDE